MYSLISFKPQMSTLMRFHGPLALTLVMLILLLQGCALAPGMKMQTNSPLSHI